MGSGNAVILSNSDGVRIAHSTRRDLIFKSWVPLKPEVKEQILKEKGMEVISKRIASTDKPRGNGCCNHAIAAAIFSAWTRYRERNSIIRSSDS